MQFLRVPKSSSKGHVHVAMLSFDERAYHGQGLYLHDAQTLLRQLGEAPPLKRLELQPMSLGADLATFGWAYDGAMVNGTQGFVYTLLALFAVHLKRQRCHSASWTL